MSMEQNELRIGNWVLDKALPVQVAGLQASGRIVVEDWGYDNGKRDIEPEPIALSNELIEKSGFEKRILNTAMPIYSGYYKEPFFIYLPGSPSSDYGFGIKGIGLIRSIKYVHELQNLAFILEGKELEINLL